MRLDYRTDETTPLNAKCSPAVVRRKMRNILDVFADIQSQWDVGIAMKIAPTLIPTYHEADLRHAMQGTIITGGMENKVSVIFANVLGVAVLHRGRRGIDRALPAIINTNTSTLVNHLRYQFGRAKRNTLSPRSAN
jgi:hypothetical protein